MTIGALDAAKRVCERGSWQVTNLALQKILYMAQMVHLGRTNERLLAGTFEAWDYGPVLPVVYQRVKLFGDKPIQDVFFSARPISDAGRSAVLEEACQHLLSKRPGELVAMTHWTHGAWAKNYVAGARGIVIPDADIIDEYNARVAAA